MHWSFWLLPVAAWGPFALSLGGKIERMWWKHLIFAVRRCGPVWTKLGQWAACRPDLLPARACRELETLQHRGGQKHSAAETEATLISCLGKEWHKNYSVFEAIGSGVIAQVHRGIRLSDNKALAFKLVHPRVRVQLEQDLIALAAGVSLLETLVPALAEWYDPSGALTQFAKSIRASVSMEKEAANLRRLRTNCGTGVALPEPILSLDNGAHSILIETLEAGLPLAHAIRELTQENMSAEYQTARSVLARRGLHCLLKMLFIDNFCHADMHPGNLLVRIQSNQDFASSIAAGKFDLILLDAGLVVELGSKHDQRNFIDLFAALALHRDGAKAGRLLLERAKHNACKDPEAFVRDVTRLVNSILQEDTSKKLTLGRLKVADVIFELLSLSYQHKVRLDASFTNVVLAVAIVEGIGRSLDPDLDLLQEAVPFVRQALLSSSFLKKNTSLSSNSDSDDDYW
eukprot:CAMPEP_0197286920 /NCGR_PEP_ID=MMETSP0890-20130614/2747_1 /TAXON_ID=44058 ORGANISM="Aureoumbra lagunensis, Strain CCMP1510" /NCGR_SAMPLE_ID=MMETSP0890 /ASSEMBLY_ACC=CAM_ASM_000533 /LENGTH=458 /DNA_ID=CAMNT_0042755895 /DNA_START=234 /DNA_END=1607 /DNA_ORIENTATION=+